MAIDQHTLMKFWTHSPVGMALVEASGQFRRVNPHFEEITGYSAYELERMRWQDITLQSDVDADAAMVAEVIAGHRESYSMDKTYIRKPPKNGLQPINLTVYPLYKSGAEEIDCLLVIAKPKEPKAVIDEGHNGSVSVTAKEGEIHIGWDKKSLALIIAIATSLVGWGATVAYAVKRVDSLEKSVRFFEQEIIKNSVKK